MFVAPEVAASTGLRLLLKATAQRVSDNCRRILIANKLIGVSGLN